MSVNKMKEKVLFHVDVNSAFLSWEAVYRIKFLGAEKDLREYPSVVGGDQEKRHGIILAKSMSAKQYGIKTGEPIVKALSKCPNLIVVPPHYNLYEKSSKAFIDILNDCSPDVEQYSVDEAFVDMTGMQALFGEPVKSANEIRKRIEDELGFTVNIGVSSNKLLAKMASDFEKPNKVHTLFPDEIEAKMWKLPVSELFFVGRATDKKLKNLGIKTIGELAKSDIGFLKSHFGKHGEVIWNFANGKDFSVVGEEPERKGYGNSTTIAFDVTKAEDAYKVLLALSESVGMRLRRDHVKAQVISVSIKDFLFRSSSHQMVIHSPTDITNELHQYACCLFDELWDGVPVRHLGIHTSRLFSADEGRQISLFDVIDYQKLETVDQMVDEIRNRYGNDAVKRGTFISGKVDHISGGISKEKLTVDYSKIKVE